VIEELGSGGMATVYRARDRELRREVAIKVLFPHLCKNKEIVARFQREARAAAGLDHPHILRVFDVGGGGEGGGEPPFIVLELVRGPSLAGIVEGGALLAELAAACGAVIAAALAHAHRAGVIHRDIKPANLLVAEGGRLVLADFGVARLAEDDSSLVTKTGALLGTPAFMSPEQATGAPLDARSDLYSVGATLYQLATGSVPVSGNAARAVAAIVAGDVVPPLRRNPAIGRDLARLIERLMAVDPAGRVASAAELEAELGALVEPVGQPDELLAELFADRAACEARVKPLAVASSVARARAAIEEGNTARALALCDRALALDAECREAVEIVESIGARRMWRRVALVLGVIVLLAGGAVGAWVMWPSGEEETTRVAAERPVVVADAAPRERLDEIADAAAPPSEETKQDAGDGQRAAGDGQRKKRPRVVETQPAPPVAVADAAPAKTETPEKPPEADARLTVEVETWCDLAIDGGQASRVTRSKTIKLRPGRHQLSCWNQGLGTQKQTVDLAPGETRAVVAMTLPQIAVLVKMKGGDAVLIDKVKVGNGATGHVKRGSHRVEVVRLGKVVDSAFVTVMRPCTLMDRPAIACR
jgi:serine/threonine-protein kinase